MDQHGVELSLNLVILVVIGLIVLSVLIWFAVKAAGGGNEARSCSGIGGHCEQSCQQGETSSSFLTGDCQKGQVCCIEG